MFTSSEFSISPAIFFGPCRPCLIQELSLLYQMNSDALDSLKADGVVGASRLPSDSVHVFHVIYPDDVEFHSGWIYIYIYVYIYNMIYIIYNYKITIYSIKNGDLP